MNLTTTFPRRWAAVIGAASLALTGMVAPSAVAAPPTAPHAAASAMTVGDLADSSDLQQRWLSEPDSRITLNQGEDVTLTSTDPLGISYYANGSLGGEQNVLASYRATADAPVGSVAADEGDQDPAFSDAFDESSVGQWSSSSAVTLASSEQGGVLSLVAGGWGVTSRTVSIDVAQAPILAVDVAATTGEWALKLQRPGEADSFATLQTDTDKTGLFAYDLRGVDGLTATGTQSVSVQLFQAGDEGSSTTFRGLSVHAAPGWSDSFVASGSDGWSTATQNGNGTTLTTTERGGVVTLPGDGYGAVEKSVTVDLTASPRLSVSIPATSAQWSLKLRRATGGDIELQHDTSATGTFSFDVAAATGLTGQQTFFVKLFVIGPGGSTVTVTRMSLHAGSAWLSAAPTFTRTWRPQDIEHVAQFDDGTITTQTAFVDLDAVTRVVSPSIGSGRPAVLGAYSGTASYDAASRTLTTSASDGRYTRAITLPQGAEVSFYSSAAAAASGDSPRTAPASGTSAWVALLPAAEPSAIGIGYARATGTTQAEAARSAALRASSVSAAQTAIAQRASEWDEYLAKVPEVQDYSLSAVDPDGVDAATVRRMYYMAFVALRENVLPPEPESGSTHRQIATGKPSGYTGGAERNRASASWDSLLGMQYYAYVDPDVAWDAFTGMMADVADDGGLGGESLPSRKAQTAWMLYNVTGDREKLAAVYDDLKRHLAWEGEHLAWNYGDHGGHDERDAEFVVSLAIDEGFAIDIARTIGRDGDVAGFQAAIDDLRSEYAQWFFPGGRAVQYIWLGGGTGDPDGTSQYVATGLHMPDLTEAQRSAVMARFDEDYDPAAQFAGLAADAVKAPDAQYVAYGLLEQGEATKAEVFLSAVLRDVVRTNELAEVYTQAADGVSLPRVSGVRPSLFGAAQVIDNVWLLNGYRSDLGAPAFVRLPHTTGGVSGLTYLGQQFGVDVQGAGVELSGELTGQTGLCRTTDLEAGQQTALRFTCGDVTASASTVPAGGTVTLSGARFPASTPLEITFDGSADPLARATTDAVGAFRVTVRVPPGTPAGRHTLGASANGVSGEAAVVVAGPPTHGTLSVSVPVLSKASQAYGSKPGLLASLSSQVSGATSGTVTFRSGTRVLGSASVVRSGAGYAATLTLPATLKVGTYRGLTATLVAGGTTTVSSPSAATFQVVKATAKKVKVTGKKFKAGTKPKVKVKVGKLSSGQKPVGKIKVYVGKKVIKTARLKAKKNGKITVKLPKKYSGTIKVKATFVPKDKTAVKAKKSKAVKVKTKK